MIQAMAPSIFSVDFDLPQKLAELHDDRDTDHIAQSDSGYFAVDGNDPLQISRMDCFWNLIIFIPRNFDLR